MSGNWFFEGPEKKVEIILKSSESLNLLQKDTTYWEHVVGLASARILSSLENQDCKAFLLSESSLFVWKDRLILITCGTTELIRAVDFLVEDFGKDQIVEIFYERKNEYHPDLQKSSAREDMGLLLKKFDGQALRLGRQDDHHVYVFNQLGAPSQTRGRIRTLELLMYGLRGSFNEAFTYSAENKTRVFEELAPVFEGFEVDSYFFDPTGFSLNALQGSQYATIHVTPQGDQNYFSFEMDSVSLERSKEIVEYIVGLLKPTSFDIVLFSPDEHEELRVFEEEYQPKQICTSTTASGYKVVYKHFFDPQCVKLKPENMI